MQETINGAHEFLFLLGLKQGDTETSDVTFVIGDQKKLFHAHQFVLKLWSDVFAVALSNGMKESETKQIVIKDTDPATFNMFIEFMYGGRFQLCFENVADMLHLSTKYNIKYLKGVCTKFLSQNMSHETVLQIFNSAVVFNDGVLIEKCLDYLKTSIKEIMLVSPVHILDMEAFELLLKTEPLNCSEIFLFEKLLEWGSCHTKKTNNNLKATIAPLIEFIRFPLIKGADLVEKVQGTGVLPDKLYIEALEFHASPKSFPNRKETRFRARKARRHHKKEITFSFDPKRNGGLILSNNNEQAEGDNSNWSVLGAKQLEGIMTWRIRIEDVARPFGWIGVGVGTKTTNLSGFTRGETDRYMYSSNGYLWSKKALSNAKSGYPEYSKGDIIGVETNLEGNKISFFKNNKIVETLDVVPGEKLYPLVLLFKSSDKCSIVTDK